MKFPITRRVTILLRASGEVEGSGVKIKARCRVDVYRASRRIVDVYCLVVRCCTPASFRQRPSKKEREILSKNKCGASDYQRSCDKKFLEHADLFGAEFYE